MLLGVHDQTDRGYVERMVISTPTEFAAAVAEHPFQPYAFDAETLAEARGSLADAGLLLVGEPHGVRETPGLLYALASMLETRAVAFEWSYEEMEEPVRGFLRSGSFDFEQLWSLPASSEFFCSDGRITAGHFALLGRLYAEGRLDQVIVFDRLDTEPLGEWVDYVRMREPEMASRILSEWDRSLPLLVLTGAFHAQLESVDGEPMAAFLARELPGLKPVMLDYARGHFFSRGEIYDLSGPMPASPLTLRVGEGTPALLPGRPA